MEESSFEPVFGLLYDRLTKGYTRVMGTSGEKLLGGWNRVDDWVMKLFEVEFEMRRRMAASLLDRPFGSMRTKEPVRKGAYSEIAAIAYARWNKPSIEPEALKALYARYISNFHEDNRPIDQFVDEELPSKPFERLLIVTPSAMYSGHSGMVERYRFADHQKEILTLSVPSIARSMRNGLSERHPTSGELSDLFDDERGPSFLVRSCERARSLSR
jgi:hypothetical protein